MTVGEFKKWLEENKVPDEADIEVWSSYGEYWSSDTDAEFCMGNRVRIDP